MTQFEQLPIEIRDALITMLSNHFDQSEGTSESELMAMSEKDLLKLCKHGCTALCYSDH